MSNQDDDFQARVKRVRVKPGPQAQPLGQMRGGDDGVDEKAMGRAILRPQLALVLGAVGLIVGRGIAMNYLMIEPSTDLLGLGEGAIIVAILVVFGLLFGKSDHISHGALVVGASLAFLGESFYIPLMPDLMGSIYNQSYVSLVFLNAQ